MGDIYPCQEYYYYAHGTSLVLTADNIQTE